MFKFIQSHRIKITVIAALSVIGGGAFAMAGQAKAKKAAEARAAAAAAPKSPFVARYAGDVRVMVLAPEDPLPRYIAACDVILTLPSGAISTLAAVSGKPLVHLPTTNPWQAQTANFFSSRGMSLFGKEYDEAAILALSIAKDEAHQETMRNLQQSESIPNAAQRVVRFLHEGRL